MILTRKSSSIYNLSLQLYKEVKNTLQISQRNQNSYLSQMLYHSQKYTIINTQVHEQEKLKLSKAKAFLKDLIFLIKEGTKQTYYDTIWLYKLYKKKKSKRFTSYELKESKRIKIDLVKFFPFASLLIIPGGELLLPPYLALFPNSVPTQFTFDYKWDEYIENIEKKQFIAHEHLSSLLKEFLVQGGAYLDELTQSESFQHEFFEQYEQFDKYLNFKNMSTEELILVANFLGISPIKGTRIINLTFKLIVNMPIYLINFLFFCLRINKKIVPESRIFNYQFKFNGWLKSQLILYQINRHFQSIRHQDKAFYKFGAYDIQGYQITQFARERGLATISCYETLRTVIQNDWVEVTKSQKFSNNNMLWYSVMYYDILRSTNQEQN